MKSEEFAYFTENSYFCSVIELNRHIEILLLSNDCVIVPGLGGFMAHHVAARYDETDGLFLPPLRTLGFNPQLKLNDSLLAQSYVEAYDISYPEALCRIEDEVNELKQRLDNEGQYELNDIGTLSVNEDGNYVFEPCESGILTPSLYGLSSFEMKPLEAGSVVKEVGLLVKETATADKELASNILPMPVDGEERAETELSDAAVDEENEADMIRIKVAWVRNAVAVAVAVAAFFIFTTPIGNSSDNGFSVGDMQKSEFMGIVSNTVAPDKDRTLDSSVVKTAALADDQQAAVTDSTAPERQKTLADRAGQRDSASAKTAAKDYCIVLASHVTHRNAKAYVDQLHAEGYDQAYTYEHANIVKVVYGHYKDESSACNELRKLRESEYFEQSWIYKKR